MKKICKKRIFVILSIIMISFVALNFCYTDVSAQLNPDTSTVASNMAEGFKDILSYFEDFALNSVFSGFATLLTILAALLYFILATIFSGATGSIFPSPDNIIFNRIAILDVNFFNPNPNSLIGMAGSESNLLIPQIYNSFHAIAVSLFVIAAMLVGIKMALSTAAADKASAKKAMINWIIGILVLFLMRLIIAAIFELNEYVVWKVAEASNTGITFYIDTSLKAKDLFNFLGSPLTTIIKGIGAIGTFLATGTSEVALPGYNGMLLMFAYNAVCGDILAAILLFVLLGQTITLFVAYARRLMYTIILGLCAPLVVAIDTINKSTKGQSTILSNWFKEFTGTVFVQSFHAVLMLVTLHILSALVADENASSTFVGIAAIVLTSGLVKFEKLYKQIFGMSEGMMGGLKGQAGKVMAGVHGATQGIKAIADNGQKYKKANTAKKVAISEKESAVKSYGKAHFERSEVNFREALKTITNPEERAKFADRALRDLDIAEKSGYGSREGEKEKMEQYRNFLNDVRNGNYVPGQENQTGNGGNLNGISRSQIATAAQAADYLAGVRQGVGGAGILTQNASINTNNSNTTNTTMNNSRNSSTTNNSNTQTGGGVSTKELEQELSKLTREISNMNKKNDSVQESKRKIDDANKKVQQANSDLMSAAFATATSPINLAAGIGFGIGTGDDLSEAALKGGYVTKGLDALAEKIGSEVGRNMKAFDKHATVDNTN